MILKSKSVENDDIKIKIKIMVSFQNCDFHFEN